MVKSNVNVAAGDLFRGKVVSCPEKVDCLNGLSFNCQYSDGYLKMSGRFSVKTSLIDSNEGISIIGNLVYFATKSGSTYVLQMI